MKRKYLKFGIQYNDIDALGDAMSDVQPGGGGGRQDQGGRESFREPPKKPATSAPDAGDADDSSAPPPDPAAERERRRDEALAELAQTVTTLAKPKPEAPKPRTPEEEAKYWGVFQPTESGMREIFGIGDDVTPEQYSKRMTYYQQLHNGIVRQAVTTAMNLIQQNFGKLVEGNSSFKEILEWREQQRSRQAWSDFGERYPDLADKKYKKVLRICAEDLADREFKSDDEYFDALADSAVGLIKGIDDSFEINKPDKQNQPGKLPRLPRSGGGGTGGAGKPAPRKTSGDDIDSLGDPSSR
jgi:hypothetical protein